MRASDFFDERKVAVLILVSILWAVNQNRSVVVTEIKNFHVIEGEFEMTGYNNVYAESGDGISGDWSTGIAFTIYCNDFEKFKQLSSGKTIYVFISPNYRVKTIQKEFLCFGNGGEAIFYTEDIKISGHLKSYNAREVVMAY